LEVATLAKRNNEQQASKGTYKTRIDRKRGRKTQRSKTGRINKRRIKRTGRAGTHCNARR